MSGKKWERRRKAPARAGALAVAAAPDARGERWQTARRGLREADEAVERETTAMVERLGPQGGGAVDRAKVGVLRAVCWGFFLLYAHKCGTVGFLHQDRDTGRTWRFDLTLVGQSAVLCGEHEGVRAVLAEVALAPVADGSRVRWRADDDEIARYPDPGFLPKPESEPEPEPEPEPVPVPVPAHVALHDEDRVNVPLIAARCGWSAFPVHKWVDMDGFPEPRSVYVYSGKRFREWAWGEVAEWLCANGKVRAGSPLAQARRRQAGPA